LASEKKLLSRRKILNHTNPQVQALAYTLRLNLNFQNILRKLYKKIELKATQNIVSSSKDDE